MSKIVKRNRPTHVEFKREYYRDIEKVCRERGTTGEKLAEYMGLSYNYFRGALRQNSIRKSVWEDVIGWIAGREIPKGKYETCREFIVNDLNYDEIKSYYKSKGFTLKSFADTLGITPTKLYNIKRGRRVSRDLYDRLKKLMKEKEAN